jgi:hypothetical protein
MGYNLKRQLYMIFERPNATKLGVPKLGYASSDVMEKLRRNYVLHGGGRWR